MMQILRASALGLAVTLAPLGAQARDVVEVAAQHPQLKTLVRAVEAAGLVDTLRGQGPFTIFAPSDEAFAGLPEPWVEHILQPDRRAQLTEILTFHVVPGRLTASDLAGRSLREETVEGATLTIDGRSGVTVDGASVVQADIEADNGVIHIIDAVLTPPRL
jgi:uncharacterized surface protein with fasciclin (FAS1) repeats